MQEIFHIVSKIGYSAEYVENMSPVERQLILFYYKEELKEQRNAERRQNEMNSGPTIGSPINTM